MERISTVRIYDHANVRCEVKSRPDLNPEKDPDVYRSKLPPFALLPLLLASTVPGYAQESAVPSLNSPPWPATRAAAALRPSGTGRRSSARCPRPITCAGGYMRHLTARPHNCRLSRTTRKTPSGFCRSSRAGDWMRRSRPSMCSFLRRRSARLSWSRQRYLRPSSRSHRFRTGPYLRTSRQSSCLPITPTRSMAT